MKEEIGERVPEIELLTENLAALFAMLQTHNDVLLCLLHKFDIDEDLPAWVTKEGVEEEVGPKIQACIEKIRSIYGPGKTDKD